MKKLAFALTALAALSLLAPTSGSAAQGTVGMYLDSAATTWENGSIAAFSSVPIYVCVVDHDFPALYGYEFGYEYTGNITVLSAVMQGTGPIDVGGGAGNHIVGVASPITATPVTLICAMSVFLLDANPVEFKIKGATPNSVPGSTTPAVLLAGDQIVRCGTSGWDGSAPAICLTINETGEAVATDEVSFDGVKSLFR